MSPATAFLAVGAPLVALLLPVTVLADENTGRDALRAAFTCHGRPVTIVGTQAPDRIAGTSGDDVIASLGGRDRVHGGDGNDVICGGPGPDHLYGGRGDDILEGQGSRDILLGIAGDDRLYGGRDGVVHRGDGAHVQGDRLQPGPGNDFIDAGDDPRQRRLDDDQNRPDLVAFGGTTGIVARLGDPGRPGAVTSGTDRDVIAGQRVIELLATAGDDVVVGGSGAERIVGLSGRDRLLGRGGDDEIVDGRGGRFRADRLSGGPGDDRISSSQGPDLVTGGSGDDQVFFVMRVNPNGGPPPCSTARAGAGHDLLAVLGLGSPGLVLDAGQGRLSSSWDVGCDVLVGYESYAMTSDADMTFLGTAAPEELRAEGINGLTAMMGAGDDVVTGTRANDVIDAGDGVDVVDARGGIDECVSAETSSSCETVSP